MIDWREARAGDVFFSPAGTIHALGPGLTLVEVQQNVDCTYRLYDYGRPRQPHLDSSLAVARPEPHVDPRERPLEHGEKRLLGARQHFTLLHLSGQEPNALLSLTNIPLTPATTSY